MKKADPCHAGIHGTKIDGAKRIPAGDVPARMSTISNVARSVDDLDDPARARLDDHPAIIDDGVEIFGIARNLWTHSVVGLLLLYTM